jgi:NADH-quinone oxidoreductase subunit H
MDVGFLIEKTVLIVVIFGATLLIALYETFGERRIAGFFQDRLGPNRAGPLGLLQPLADGVKMLTKEDFIPNTPNKFLFILGPSLAMTTSLMTSAVIPWGKTLDIFGRTVSLQVADLNIGVLYSMGVVSIGVYGIMIGGWASNNKFSLLGAVRASSQMISYEIAMGLSIIAIVMMTGSLSLRDMVEQQQGLWNIIPQVLGGLIFIVCAFAECNRTPFDLPECESELVGGYHTEYSSMKLGFFLFAEYVNMFISSALISALYFGGYHYPGSEWIGNVLGANVATLVGLFAFLGKTFFFVFFFMWVRWTVPRFRYDQLMNLGWKYLIPISIANVLLTGLFILLKDKFL